MAHWTKQADPLDAPLHHLYTPEREALILAAPNALYHRIKCEYTQRTGIDALW